MLGLYRSYLTVVQIGPIQKLPYGCPNWRKGGGVKASFGQCPKKRRFFLCFFPVICMQQFKRRNIITLICIPKSLWFPALSALIALKCTRHVLCYRICQNGCHRASLSATWHQCLQQCISVCNRASLFAIGLQCMQHSITVCNIASVSATVHHCLQHSITV